MINNDSRDVVLQRIYAVGVVVHRKMTDVAKKVEILKVGQSLLEWSWRCIMRNKPYYAVAEKRKENKFYARNKTTSRIICKN